MSTHSPSVTPAVLHLIDRRPQVAPGQMIAELVPPPQFEDVSFDSYRPDPAQPTQTEAVEALRAFAGAHAASKGVFGRIFGGKPKKTTAGIYLDGGYGVGKTHLLASLWHASEKPAAFGTFVEYTNLVGALGFRNAVEALKEMKLVCVDEFELDDPGDTVLMSRLMRELADAGVKIAATSNTLPDALGQGRFAAQDFLREIQVLASQFTVLHIDGDDYRHRGLPTPPQPVPSAQVEELAAEYAGKEPGVALDSFPELIQHLASIHPSRYRGLLAGVHRVFWTDVETITDEGVALRLVVLIDRLYDREVPLVTSGVPLDHIVTPGMLGGGYKKKYLRAISRLTALAREGENHG